MCISITIITWFNKKKHKKESNQFEQFFYVQFSCSRAILKNFMIKIEKSYFYVFYCIIVIVHYNMLKKFDKIKCIIKKLLSLTICYVSYGFNLSF